MVENLGIFGKGYAYKVQSVSEKSWNGKGLSIRYSDPKMPVPYNRTPCTIISENENLNKTGRTVALTDLRSEAIVQEFRRPKFIDGNEPRNICSFQARDTRMVTGDQSGMVLLWDRRKVKQPVRKWDVGYQYSSAVKNKRIENMAVNSVKFNFDKIFTLCTDNFSCIKF